MSNSQKRKGWKGVIIKQELYNALVLKYVVQKDTAISNTLGNLLEDGGLTPIDDSTLVNSLKKLAPINYRAKNILEKMGL